MDLISLIVLAFGLSFDTFSVSISCGIKDKEIKFIEAARIAFYFAFFQAFMPVLGWLLGITIRDYVVEIDHWIAFGLLSVIGIKMLIDSMSNNQNNENCIDIQNIKVILTLSVATTIDAFVIGLTFAFLQINMLKAIIIIGIITFLTAMFGMLFGKKAGQYFGKKIEIIGALILISIGVKILIEHLTA